MLENRNAAGDCQRAVAIRYGWVLCLAAFYWAAISWDARPAIGQNRYATSDSMSGYVHWIDLYDENNSRIDPNAENPKPYSPAKTCGRCHEYDTISHGWHFNAVEPNAELAGRPGQPWIWSDDRTGTHLPLSFRGWKGTHHPDEIGLSRWQVAAKFGGFMPGGGVGGEESLATAAPEEAEDRSGVTGALPVDCMMCHHSRGSGYSPFVWTEQIEDENFAFAPVAALGLASVSGSMSRLKDDFDPKAEDAASKLPKVAYRPEAFREDGKVFFDLIRKPQSDACYYCHTNASLSAVQGERWLHDEDVHLRAGLECADCHRNGLDHHTVRGFEGEQHPAGTLIASLSCAGCHMQREEAPEDFPAGRFGAPQPLHRGLPPLHFDKLSCTACHSGPLPTQEFGRQINSIAHHLGEHVKRTGTEAPAILAGMQLPVEVAEAAPEEETEANRKLYTPHRMMWPSFWATIEGSELKIHNPDAVYDAIRRPLKVRREFQEELAEVKLSLTRRKELLGDDRARAKPDEWTAEEKTKMAAAEEAERKVQVAERMAAALKALEEEFPTGQAVFVTGGTGFVRDGESAIKEVDSAKLNGHEQPYAWPMGHNVRPARQALGATGCTECHSEGSTFFNASLTPVGVLPGQVTDSIAVHELQGADMERLSTWNQMFAGRSTFKVAGLIALFATILISVSALALNLGASFRRFWR